MPSVPAGSVGPTPEGAVTDAGVGYVALSSCLQGGRQPVHKGECAVGVPEGVAFVADRARGGPSSSPLGVPPAATEADGIDMSMATIPPATVLALQYHSAPWQVAVK